MAAEITFREVDLSRIIVTVEFPDLSKIELDWDTRLGEPKYRGAAHFTSNSMIRASMLDYANRTLMAQRPDDELDVDEWDDIALAVRADEDADDVADGEADNVVDEGDCGGKQEEKTRRKKERQRRKKRNGLDKSVKNAKKTLQGYAELLAFGFDEEGDKQGWCSVCCVFSVYKKIATPKTWVPSYRCSNCGGATRRCRLPGCEHFALRSLGPVDAGAWCAEHDNSMPDFDRQHERIAELSDWKKIWEPRAKNMSLVTKVGAGVVGAGLLLTPFFAAAAPAIGGAIGAVAGYSGVVAQNYGLALIAGGAKTAGGLGMAGGKLVIAMTGTAVGGATGNRVVGAYTRDDKSFGIRKIRGGSGPTVVYASGWLTEKTEETDDWVALIDTAYPDSPIYRVTWGAKELRALTAFGLSNLATAQGKRLVVTVAKQATKLAAKRLNPVAGIHFAASILTNPWTTAINRSEQAGKTIAALIARTDAEEGFILVGHSLGGRLMARATEELGIAGVGANLVRGVHLLGAAFGTGRRAGGLGKLGAPVINYHSRNDQVLKMAFRGAHAGWIKAAGLVGIEGVDAGPVVNKDVSGEVDSHDGYFRKVKLENIR
ncbi:TMCO4 family protein [Corynebacterium cystitidis]|uniref:TMCO4 family protein n=1 Tax=Corynebacterium cystitidis TaxID=35757 RepID=UPI00211F14B5|nr:TMCO4 family protein [Corynebacterium cystitidis]